MEAAAEPLIDAAGAGAGRAEELEAHRRGVFAAVGWVGVWLAAKLLLGAWLVAQATTQRDLLYCLPLIYLLYRAATAGVYAKAALHWKDTELVFAGCHLLIAAGFLLYTLRLANGLVCEVLALPLIGFSVANLVRQVLAMKAGPSDALHIAEAVQLLLLPHVYERALPNESWGLKLLYYNSFAELCLILSRVLRVTVLFCFVLLLLSYHRLPMQEKMLFYTLMLAGWLLSFDMHYSWALQEVLVELLSRKAFGAAERTLPLEESAELGRELLSCYAFIAVAFGLVTVKVVLPYLRHLRGLRPRTVSIVNLPSLMRSSYSQISDTFFKKKVEDVELGPVRKAENCSICLSSPAEVIIKPCGHGGACQNCITLWVQTNPSCPLCKTPITGVDVIVLDETSNTLMTKAHLKINEAG